MVRIGGSGSVPLQRVSSSTAQVATQSSQQATDGVVDLTNNDHADTQTELNTSADQANFLRIEVGGEDYFLDLQPLDPQQREQVLNDLKAQILDGNGEVSADFNADDFFRAIDGENNTFQVGEGRSEVTFDGNVDQSQAVLDRSNEGEDTYFDFMNNNETSLSSSGASEHVGDKNKPAAWYNGFQIENGEVNTYRSALDTRNVTTPELTMQDYQNMLIADFNFNGAIDQFQELGGQDAFVQAMQERFPDHHLGQDGLAVLAEHVWSYATTGHDANEPPRTNIAEMQGMLYELDPRIQHSSDTNTPMSDRPFTVDGIDTPLRLGDGLHGRATILTTRHLLSGTNVERTEAPTMEITSFVDKFDARDRFVKDGSGSTAFGVISDAIRDTYGLEKVKVEGVFGMYGSKISGSEKMGGVDSEVNEELNDFSNVLDEAYRTLAPNATETEARAFAEIMGLSEEQFDTVFRERRDGTYQMNGDRLMREIGDYTTDAMDRHNKHYGAAGESSFKALLTTMLFDPDYSDEALQEFNDDARDERPRLNTFTDEPEQSPEYLQLVQAIAEHKNIDVRVVAVDSGQTRNLKSLDQMEAGVTVIDINTMDPDDFQSGMELDRRVVMDDDATSGKGQVYKWREGQRVISEND